MRKKINEYEVGECVAIDNAVRGTQGIIIRNIVGIILKKELVELDQDLSEWLYTISLPELIDDFWPYEIKPVNSLGKPYNTHSKLKGDTHA